MRSALPNGSGPSFALSTTARTAAAALIPTPSERITHAEKARWCVRILGKRETAKATERAPIRETHEDAARRAP